MNIHETYKLEPIGEMPKMTPKYVTQPGVVTPPLPPEKQSVVDAFNVSDQQFTWLAEAVAKVNRNLGVVLACAMEALSQAQTVQTRLDRIQQTPWRMTRRAVRWVAIFAAGVMVHWAIKHWLHIDIDPSAFQ